MSELEKVIAEKNNVSDPVNHPPHYRDICDELASLVESADGDITGKEYVDWWNENISHHEEDW